MTRYLSFLYTLFLGLSLSSCATLFNRPTTRITLHTPSPAEVTVYNPITSPDQAVIHSSLPLKTYNNQLQLSVTRSPQHLVIHVHTDSLGQELKIGARNSFAYWSNLAFIYGIGMLVDRTHPKRYTYPRHIYIQPNHSPHKYLLYDPQIRGTRMPLFKITPLKLIGFDNPGVEIAIEKATSHRWSTQLMGSYLFPSSLWVNDWYPRNSGYRIAIEQRHYFLSTAPLGGYSALEVNYLNRHAEDSWQFVHRSNAIDSLPMNQQKLTTESYRIFKQTVSIQFKIGYQFSRGKMLFDFYGGLGVRYKDVRETGKTPSQDVVHYRESIRLKKIGNESGQYWTVSLPLNFRVGYYFGHRARPIPKTYYNEDYN